MFLCENSRYHIFMWEFWYRWLWVKYFFSNFHPKTWQIKIPSIGDKILSMDTIISSMDKVILFMGGKISSMDKIILSMDKSVICGKKSDGWSSYQWMSSMDKKYQWRRRMTHMDSANSNINLGINETSQSICYQHDYFSIRICLSIRSRLWWRQHHITLSGFQFL